MPLSGRYDLQVSASIALRSRVHGSALKFPL